MTSLNHNILFFLFMVCRCACVVLLFRSGVMEFMPSLAYTADMASRDLKGNAAFLSSLLPSASSSRLELYPGLILCLLAFHHHNRHHFQHRHLFVIIFFLSLTLAMASKGMIVIFRFGKSKIDIVDVATSQVMQQHDVEGALHWMGASVQNYTAAMAIYKPYHGVHVVNIKSGKMLCKFMLPYSEDAMVALSKDALTLCVGSSTGVSW
jgi:hypothetical protein